MVEFVSEIRRFASRLNLLDNSWAIFQRSLWLALVRWSVLIKVVEIEIKGQHFRQHQKHKKNVWRSRSTTAAVVAHSPPLPPPPHTHVHTQQLTLHAPTLFPHPPRPIKCFHIKLETRRNRVIFFNCLPQSLVWNLSRSGSFLTQLCLSPRSDSARSVQCLASTFTTLCWKK